MDDDRILPTPRFLALRCWLIEVLLGRALFHRYVGDMVALHRAQDESDAYQRGLRHGYEAGEHEERAKWEARERDRAGMLGYWP